MKASALPCPQSGAPLLERLINGGKVTRGYLGVLTCRTSRPVWQQQFNLPGQNGALVGDVLPDTPAEKAGIKSGDVIVAFNGKDVSDAARFAARGFPMRTRQSRHGEIDPRRRAKKLSPSRSANLPGSGGGNSDEQNNSDSDTSNTDALDGVTVADLDRDTRQELKIPDSVQGAIVTDVDAGFQLRRSRPAKRRRHRGNQPPARDRRGQRRETLQAGQGRPDSPQNLAAQRRHGRHAVS